jgi:hypothetical protein
MWDRPRLYVGSLAVAVLFPIGFYVLVRAYAAGGGRWPSPWLNALLAVLGTLVALAAAVRAQAAPTRRAFLAEAVPGLGGFALLAFALGTPTGISAGVATVLAAAVLSALLPLLPESGEGRAAAVLVVLVAGAPPAATFAARALTVQAGIEAGDGWAFLAVAAAVAWLLTFAGAARALRLPVLGHGAEGGGSAAGAGLAALILLAGGAGLGLVASRICVPATAEVMEIAPGVIGGDGVAVLTSAGAWAAVALGAPLLLLAALAALASRGAAALAVTGDPPGPLLPAPLGDRLARLRTRLAGVAVPEQYRSLVNPRAIEAAMGRGQPLLWAVLLLALAVAVNR